MQNFAGDDESGAAAAAHLRIDKWLWCARFFKTRGLAQSAVEGGHVQVNGERVKPARHVKIGDRIRITRERERFEVLVTGIPRRRGPGAEARLHYVESAESLAAREQAQALDRLSGPVSDGRPGKRDRRDLLRLRKGQD